MSLDGVSNDVSADREIVDLIWFPTGGGKTEAYLGVMAFYMFYQRLLMERRTAAPRSRRDEYVLMRYTLRMLTTQQFQTGRQPHLRNGVSCVAIRPCKVSPPTGEAIFPWPMDWGQRFTERDFASENRSERISVGPSRIRESARLDGMSVV